jgi:hypothetical protein
MSTPRYRHTATLLKTGQVLIAGGEDPGGPVSSAEIYDPATGQFTSVGSMALAHSEHTATLLVDGRVLISSGRCFCFDKSGGGLTATAELFDPATQTFTSTGSLLTQRAGHSAALLANGKVLVAAGYTNLPQIVATNGELYDPGTGLFTETGPMVTPRIQQTTNVLLNGNVLIVGGTQTAGAGNLASGEVYDWSTGEFTAVPGSMSITREFAAAALLPSGDVLITGGFDGHVFSATAEIYVAGN